MTTYIDLNEYYKLKNDYELSVKKSKRTIMNTAKISMKDKKALFRKIKPKCIACKQSGGTIFTSKYDATQRSRTLIARCGHYEDQCGLDIKINAGKYVSIRNAIVEGEQTVEALKNEVIKTKNRLLFGYTTTESVLADFARLKDEINEGTNLLTWHTQAYNDIVDNKETNEAYKTATIQHFENVQMIKDTIEKYNVSNNKQLIRDLVKDIYIAKMIPNAKDIMDMKYKRCSVWYNEDDGTYHLMQEPTIVENLEMDLIEPEILTYNSSKERSMKPDRSKDDPNYSPPYASD
jgi:hypothetical protein